MAVILSLGGDNNKRLARWADRTDACAIVPRASPWAERTAAPLGRKNAMRHALGLRHLPNVKTYLGHGTAALRCALFPQFIIPGIVGRQRHSISARFA